jgi:outer membrane biosynthesis protein TonB
MNNYYAMSATMEAKNRQQAAIITAGFAAFMFLLMFLLKWDFPSFEKIVQEPGIEVELNLPEEPIPQTLADGGGGGGNPVQAAGPAGIAPETPPAPGEPDDSKELEEDPKSESPAITKPPAVKPEATKITNKSIAKAEPKPVETPAPPRPKAVLGKTTTGAGRGGGTADDYDRAGGSGNGNGVGSGNGTGGGTGNGTGGGNGTGSGRGNGPKVTRGDRKIVRYYSFEGDLDKAVIYANVLVSPEGVGKFISIAKGSSNSSNAYKEAIIQYLQNIKFDKADHESMLTVQFNFRVN